ncbi:MAG: hypothetical protein ACP5C3_07670 [Methanomicrobiales archaeon]
MDWVVKVGGSLFPENAIKLGESMVGKNVLIICGGGTFANQVRKYDTKIGFSQTSNHKSAIKCMDIVGILLADKINGAEAVYSIEDAKNLIKESKLPILLPSYIIEFLDPLKHSWKVTSDSLSFYISHLLETKLIIATDVDGIYSEDPSSTDAKLIKNISAKKLLSFGETSIDEALPQLLLKYKSNCHIVNGKYPKRAISIIDGKSKGKNNTLKYTFIRGD